MPPSRIDELRRRVQNDPASIAFAQLAEEYRRAGQTEDAVRVCREGLTRHPGYLSARVTLGRALLDLGQLAEARGEFEFVVAEAPENLAAVRGLAEICHRDGQTADALTYYERALALSRHDPEIEEIVQQLSRQLGAAASTGSTGLSFEEAHEELLSAAERVPLATPPASAPIAAAATEGSTAPFDFDRLVAALGSPTAPPQFEAAVTGAAAVAPIELPEVADLGPNPFAALEAELRAHDAPAPKPAPWDPAPVEPEPVAAAPVAEPASLRVEGLVADAPPSGLSFEVPAPDADPFAGLVSAPEVPTAPPVALAAPDVAIETMLAEAIDLASHEPATKVPSAVEALLAAPEHSVESSLPTLSVDAAPVPDALGSAEPAPDAPPAPAPAVTPAAAPEGVLDDLENWLSTLHDRGSE